MRTRRDFHAALAACVLALAACGRPGPYDDIADPPLVRGRLHAVTLAGDVDAAAARLTAAGYRVVALPPNYPQAVTVEASIWGVPEPVAAAVRDFKAPRAGLADVRLLAMPLAARDSRADERTNRAFFRNVLGSDVPAAPLAATADDMHVRVWTFVVPDVAAAAKRLRENGLPVNYGPVALTTSYLGDHRTAATRAPDGTVVQLVETTTH